MPADEGRRDDPQREVEGEEKEGGQKDSRLGPDVEVAAGGGPSQEDERAYPPLPVASIPRKQEPGGMWTLSPQLLYLTVPLHNTDASAVPDHTQKESRFDENTESNAAANGKKSSWKSTAYATAKLLLYGVRDSADAFAPLKSVAGGLCFILENCEVWFSLAALSQLLLVPQRVKGNEQTIESLAHRVKALAESLRSPVSEGDVKEQQRRKTLEQ